MGKIKSIIFSIFIVAFLLAGAHVSATTYYVDSVNGDDAVSGTSEATAWKTIVKVNTKSLNPGDAVLFKSGQTFDSATTLYSSSGNSSSYVTYGSYGTGSRPVLFTASVSGKSYMKFQNLRFFADNTSKNALVISNGSHDVIVENCDIISGPSSSAYSSLFLTINVSNNIIRGNFIEHQNLTIQNDAVNITKNANYNLIENNTIGTATHYSMTLEGSNATYPDYTCSFNVIRNNTLENTKGAIFEIMSNSNNNLIEGNTFSGGESSSFNNNLPRSFKSVSRDNVIRKNVIRNNPSTTSSGIAVEVYQYNSDPPNIATGNRIYNNVITDIYSMPLVLSTTGEPLTAIYDNKFKNNAVYNNGNGVELYVQNHATIYDNFFFNNIFYKTGVNKVLNVKGSTYNVGEVQAAYPTYFSENLQTDPELDANYQPLDQSAAIDAGTFLAYVASEIGSGTTLVVDDAKYFTDGFGIVGGDVVRVGTENVTITDVDYATNTLTFSPSISWVNGANVSLQYTGLRPDIGAFESGNVDVVAPAFPSGLVIN